MNNNNQTEPPYHILYAKHHMVKMPNSIKTH